MMLLRWLQFLVVIIFLCLPLPYFIDKFLFSYIMGYALELVHWLKLFDDCILRAHVPLRYCMEHPQFFQCGLICHGISCLKTWLMCSICWNCLVRSLLIPCLSGFSLYPIGSVVQLVNDNKSISEIVFVSSLVIFSPSTSLPYVFSSNPQMYPKCSPTFHF